MSAASFPIPFGKYRGTPVGDLPRDYLRWLRDNCDLRPQMAAAVEAALSGESREPPQSREELQRAVDRWYSHLFERFAASKEYHDDAVLVVEYAKQQMEIELGLATLGAGECGGGDGEDAEMNLDALPF